MDIVEESLKVIDQKEKELKRYLTSEEIKSIIKEVRNYEK